MANQVEARAKPLYESRFVPLPRRVIRDVVINPNMQDYGNLQDPFLRQWMNPDFVRGHAAIFAAGSTPRKGVPLDQAPSGYDKVTLFKGLILQDEMNHSFQRIEVEGVGLTPKAVDQQGAKDQPLGKMLVLPEEMRKAYGLKSAFDIFKEYQIEEDLLRLGVVGGRMLGTIFLDGDKLAEWISRNNISSNFPTEEAMRFMFQNSPPALAVKLQRSETVDDFVRMRDHKVAAVDMLRRTAMMWVLDTQYDRQLHDTLRYSDTLKKLKAFAEGEQLTGSIANILRQLMFVKLGTNMHTFNDVNKGVSLAVSPTNVDLTGSITSYGKVRKDSSPSFDIRGNMERGAINTMETFEVIAESLITK